MANRRERFKRLYPRRLENAVWNIQSIGKLSARTNYIYENKEVDEILLTLILEIKAVMIKFGLGSTDMSPVFKTEEKKHATFKEEKDELIKKLDEIQRSVNENKRSLDEALLIFQNHEKPSKGIQKTNNYKDGKKDGYWESFHDNGQLSEKGNYNDGMLKEIYEQPKSVIDAIRGRIDGNKGARMG